MLRHHTGQRWHIDGAWRGYSNLNDVLQRNDHLLEVSTTRRQYDQIVLRAIRKEHAKGILQEINAHCHVTCFVVMKRRVQRVMRFKGARFCLEETHEGVSLETNMYWWGITKRNDKLKGTFCRENGIFRTFVKIGNSVNKHFYVNISMPYVFSWLQTTC